MKKVLSVLLGSWVLVNFACISFAEDVKSIEVNIASFSAQGKNNKAIDEYVKLYSITNRHNLDLLHKISLASLDDKDAFIRAGSVIAAAQLSNTEAMPLLKKNLSDKDMFVRIWTAISISEVNDKSAIPDLVKLLDDKVDFVRISAVVSLGRLADSSLIPTIANALNDKNPNVRQMAAISLGKIGDPKAIPYLERALMIDGDKWARQALVASLEKLLSKEDKK